MDLPPRLRRRAEPLSSVAGDDTDAEGEALPGDQPPANTARTGLLIIRAWVEEGSSNPLRAAVRATTDVSAGFDRTMTLAQADEIGATVQDWLVEMFGDTAGREPRD